MNDKIKDLVPGDRVRVTFEATVIETDDGAIFFDRDNVTADKVRFGPRAVASPAFSVTKLPPLPREGDLIRHKETKNVGKLLSIFQHNGTPWAVALFNDHLGPGTAPLSAYERAE